MLQAGRSNYQSEPSLSTGAREDAPLLGGGAAGTSPAAWTTPPDHGQWLQSWKKRKKKTTKNHQHAHIHPREQLAGTHLGARGRAPGDNAQPKALAGGEGKRRRLQGPGKLLLGRSTRHR